MGSDERLHVALIIGWVYLPVRDCWNREGTQTQEDTYAKSVQGEFLWETHNIANEMLRGLRHGTREAFVEQESETLYEKAVRKALQRTSNTV